jgi:hypothetical protein
MSESVPVLGRRDRVAVTGQVARTGEVPRERPQYAGLFREPDWPPEDETD